MTTDIGAILAASVRRRVPLAAVAEQPPAPRHETLQDRAVRLRRQQAARDAAWIARRPRRFADAELADLADQQDPRGQIARWLGRGAATLALFGSAGTGKTWAAYAVGNAAVRAGTWSIAYTAVDLLADLRPGGADPAATYDRVSRCDLLVLDDVGREQVTAWSLEQMQRLLDARSRERRRLVWTTNLAYDALGERYGDPVVSRLLDDAVAVRIVGEDRRTLAPEWAEL